jgi:hypothetical protein
MPMPMPMPLAAPQPAVRVANESNPRRRLTPPYRPASMIDDAVRRRAFEAVARSLDSEAS